MRYSYTNRKEDKHKFSINCLSKCIDWKLNMNMIKNKTSFGLVKNKNKEDISRKR